MSVLSSTGYSNVRVDSSSYDEKYTRIGELITTNFAYDNVYPVNMTSSALIEKSGGVDRTVNYVYSGSSIGPLTGQGEDYTGVYRIAECSVTSSSVSSCPNNSSVLAKSEWTYDNFGQVREQKDGLGHTTGYTYDFLGRLVKTTYADGSEQHVVYNNTTHRETTVIEPADAMNANPSKPRRRATCTTRSVGWCATSGGLRQAHGRLPGASSTTRWAG